MHDKSARDGRMKIEGGWGGGEKFKDVRRFTKVLEGQRRGKYRIRRTEGRRKVLLRRAAQQGMREASTEDGRWRFLFKRHQRACRKFSPVLHPRFLPLSSSHPSRRVPFSLPVIPSGGHTRSCSIHPHIHVHTMRSRLEFQSSGR